jgi:glycosyltransferase involved in cell wall biosynthesis
MFRPVVTVIMNIRNGAPWLGEAIESVLAQSFTDWELIAWDDCSTDDNAQIVARYADPRIRYYLSAADVSLGRARELAMRLATSCFCG